MLDAADIMRSYDDKVSKLLDAGVHVLIYVGVGEQISICFPH